MTHKPRNKRISLLYEYIPFVKTGDLNFSRKMDVFSCKSKKTCYREFFKSTATN